MGRGGCSEGWFELKLGSGTGGMGSRDKEVVKLSMIQSAKLLTSAYEGRRFW